MNKLSIKYSKQDNREDIFHSSPYGRAQSGDSMGTTSTETFSSRKAINQQRKVIRGYGESRIINNATINGPRAKQHIPSQSSFSGKQVSSPANSQPLVPRNPNLTPLNTSKPAAPAPPRPISPKH